MPRVQAKPCRSAWKDRCSKISSAVAATLPIAIGEESDNEQSEDEVEKTKGEQPTGTACHAPWQGKGGAKRGGWRGHGAGRCETGVGASPPPSDIMTAVKTIKSGRKSLRGKNGREFSVICGDGKRWTRATAAAGHAVLPAVRSQPHVASPRDRVEQDASATLRFEGIFGTFCMVGGKKQSKHPLEHSLRARIARSRP